LTSGTLTVYNTKHSGVQFIKTDSQTGQPLAGAVFTLYKQNGEKIGTYTTDSSGVAIVPDDLPDGWYKGVETTAPQGYELDSTPQDFELTGNQFLKLTFEDTKVQGLLIQKIDEADNSPLFGAEFNVRTVTGTNVGTFTTDSNGQIDVTKDANGKPLPSGDYIVTETKAPAGYTIDETPKTVTVSAGNKTTVMFRDQKLQGIIIQKLDADTKAALSDAQFEVWVTTGGTNTSVASAQPAGTLLGTYTTDVNGIISLSTLPNGTYLINEIAAPNGYELDAPNQVVTVVPGATTTVTFSDHKIYGVEIIKKDSQTQQPLQGATFEIWDIGASSNTSVASGSPAGKLLGTYTTDINGIVDVALTTGQYEIVETIAPNGYQIDNAKQDVAVSAGQKTSVIIVKILLSICLISMETNSESLSAQLRNNVIMQ